MWHVTCDFRTSLLKARQRSLFIVHCIMYFFKNRFNPKRSLGFMSEWYLFREDYWRNQRRRSGLRRDDFVSKIPKEMPLWHEKDKTKWFLSAFRPNDRFGFNDTTETRNDWKRFLYTNSCPTIGQIKTCEETSVKKEPMPQRQGLFFVSLGQRRLSPTKINNLILNMA